MEPSIPRAGRRHLGELGPHMMLVLRGSEDSRGDAISCLLLSLVFAADVRLFWHPQGDYLAVQVDRFTKTRKSTFTAFELFSVKERDIPMEVPPPAPALHPDTIALSVTDCCNLPCTTPHAKMWNMLVCR